MTLSPATPNFDVGGEWKKLTSALSDYRYCYSVSDDDSFMYLDGICK